MSSGGEIGAAGQLGRAVRQHPTESAAIVYTRLGGPNLHEDAGQGDRHETAGVRQQNREAVLAVSRSNRAMFMQPLTARFYCHGLSAASRTWLPNKACVAWVSGST